MNENWKYIPVRADKSPACSHGVMDALHATEALERWPGCKRWGVATGARSGFTVLDIDSKEALEEAKRRGLPATYVVKTPKGWHFYYRYIPHAKNKVGLFNDADVRNDNGYVVCEAPGYRRVRDLEIAEPPVWLIDATREPPPKPKPTPPKPSARQCSSQHPKRPEYYRSHPIVAGTRNHVLFAIAVAAMRNGADPHGILVQVNAVHCSPPVDDREIRQIVRSASRYG